MKIIKIYKCIYKRHKQQLRNIKNKHGFVMEERSL